MLIQEALNLLTPQLTALGWVERFGGVTRRVTMPFGDGSGGTIQKAFPISCSVTEADCNNNQRYQDLVPDSDKKSLLYWEVTRELADQGAALNENRRSLRGSARLVGWLNTDKLGVNECNAAAKAARSILPILYTKFDNGGGNAIFENANIRFQFSGGSIKDKAVFERYDYGKDPDGFLLHPYDFFALDVEVFVILPLCGYTFTTGAEIICIDDSKLL